MNRALVLIALAFAGSSCGPPPAPKPLPPDLQPPEYEPPRGYDLGGPKPSATVAPAAQSAAPAAPKP